MIGLAQGQIENALKRLGMQGGRHVLAPVERVGECLLVEFSEALGAPLVGHDELDRRAHPRFRGCFRLLARVDEGESEIGLRALVGAQEFLDPAMHVVAPGVPLRTWMLLSVSILLYLACVPSMLGWFKRARTPRP